MRKSLFLSAGVLIIFLMAQTGVLAELYQYKNRDGTVVITDKKPDPGRKAVRFSDTGKKSEGPDEGKEKPPKPTLGNGKAGGEGPAASAAAAAESERKKSEEVQARRDREAARLEAEAMKEVPFSKEKQIEQRQMLEKAKRLRSGRDD